MTKSPYATSDQRPTGLYALWRRHGSTTGREPRALTGIVGFDLIHRILVIQHFPYFQEFGTTPERTFSLR
jgi:hypothetical protein